MIKKWAKILPYCIVMWFSKKFGGEYFEFQGNKFKGFRIDKGEWVLWSQDNYDKMSKKEDIRKQTKLDKKKAKIGKMFNKDYKLKEAIREDIEIEIANEKEEFESH